MKRFYRAGSEESPEIKLDKLNGEFSLIGHSYPEDAQRFYEPVLDWLTVYASEPNPSTEVTVNLDYFNTTSQKMVVDILLLLNKIFNAGHQVSVKWYYHEDDEATQEAGEEFAEMLDLPFEVLEG
ncbi:MAG: DUF1987 domain-containing protein [Salibacteraceae bacterium]